MTDTGIYDMPEAEEVFQEELEEDPARRSGIPAVRIEGVVQVDNVPGRVSGFRRFDLSTTVPQRILDDDPRRKAATIIPIDTDIRLGYSQSDTIGAGGTRLPMGMPLLLTTSDEVWACAVTISCEVSVFFELWAR